MLFRSGDATNGEYGSPYDTFISTLYNTKGLNLVSTDITDQPTTSGGFFKFYIGCSPDQGAVGNKTHIKINGNPLNVRGFMRVGFSTQDATSNLDIHATGADANQDSFGYTQLRLRTPYTPNKHDDSSGNVGEIAWDDDYFYVKVSISPHQWNRMSLSTF